MSRFRSVLASLALSAGFALFGAPLQQANAAIAERYAVDLVGEWGQRAFGTALNEHGQVTGWFDAGPASSPQQAFVWSRQSGLLGLGFSGGTGSMAQDVNDLGQVVGSYTLANGRSQAFIHDQGGMRALDTPGAVNSWATGINAHGQVTGTVELSGGSIRPFVHDGNTMQVVEGQGCCLRSNAINDHGHIVGQSERPGPSYPTILSEPFVYRDGQLSFLGALQGGAISWASDINNQGLIVGTSDDEDGVMSGFLHDPYRGMTRLGSFGDYTVRSAVAINELGEMVGGFVNFYDGDRTGAYLLSDGTLVDLQGLLSASAGAQWTLTEARGINDRGQILVWAYDTSSSAHGSLLLTPVPEPETIALLAVGLALLVVKARRAAG